MREAGDFNKPKYGVASGRFKWCIMFFADRLRRYATPDDFSNQFHLSRVQRFRPTSPHPLGVGQIVWSFFLPSLCPHAIYLQTHKMYSYSAPVSKGPKVMF